MEWRIAGHAAWRLNESQTDFLLPQPEWCCCPCHPAEQRGKPPAARGSSAQAAGSKRGGRGPDAQPRRKRGAHTAAPGELEEAAARSEAQDPPARAQAHTGTPGLVAADARMGAQEYHESPSSVAGAEHK